MSSLFGNMGNKGQQPVANTPDFSPGVMGLAGQNIPAQDFLNALPKQLPTPGTPESITTQGFQGQTDAGQGSTAYDPTPYRLPQFNVPSQGGAPIGGDISSGLSASLGGPNVAGGGWNSVTGTEFGEIDNPRYGGYTEPGWNKGAWGDDLTGWDNKGIALPNVPHGTVVQVMNPANGQMTYAMVKDRGPAARTGSGIDLLAGTRADLGLPKNSSYPIRYRIVGPAGTPIPGAATSGQLAQGQMSTQPGAQPAGQQQRQPQRKQPQKQQRRPPPQIRRSRHIAYNAQAPPAELQFLRQSLGSLPYSETTPAQEQPSEEA